MELTFGWIEASDLDNVVTLGPFQLVHFLLGAQASEFTHVKLRIPDNCVNISSTYPRWYSPRIELFVQTIKPTKVIRDKYVALLEIHANRWKHPEESAFREGHHLEQTC